MVPFEGVIELVGLDEVLGRMGDRKFIVLPRSTETGGTDLNRRLEGKVTSS